MTTVADCRALYVHVPFCRTLCGYCDFYSQRLNAAAAALFVQAAGTELAQAPAARRGGFDTIFVGGGTPTVLPLPTLEQLLALIAPLRDPAGCEFTVEANPATVTAEVADLLARAGATRVSIGAQSFDPAELRALDRKHDPADVGRTVAAVRAAGLEHFSLDLIFAIPGQTPTSWRRSLEAALELRPEHMSCYGLTYEPDTPLRAKRDAGEVQPAENDVEADLFELTRDVLGAAGLEQYETSNYARPGCECRHNLRYWNNEPYLGIGPAAVSFIDGTRRKNVPDTAAYVAALQAGRSPVCEKERLGPADRIRETAMLGLRLRRGLDRRIFAERYGVDPAEHFAAALEPHIEDGLVEITPEAVRLTRRGTLLGDVVLRDIVAAP